MKKYLNSMFSPTSSPLPSSSVSQGDFIGWDEFSEGIMMANATDATLYAMGHTPIEVDDDPPVPETRAVFH